MKVWLVWQGYYSDKGVIAVFDNEKDAEVHASMVDDGCYITEHEIGEIKYADDIKIGYNVHICYFDGKYSWARIESYSSAAKSHERGANEIRENNRYVRPTYYTVTVVSDSKEKAIKIAQDLVAQYRAEKYGL